MNPSVEEILARIAELATKIEMASPGEGEQLAEELEGEVTKLISWATPR